MSKYQKLEQKIIVTLYEVIESGNLIRHDSPVIGAYETYGHWKKNHGLYSTKDKAKLCQFAVIEEKLNEGYERTKSDDYLATSSKDLYVNIKKLEVDKTDISKDGKGNLYYDGKKIL